MNTTTIPGNPIWNESRVQSQPKTTVAPATAVRTIHCTTCAGDGIQSVRTPNPTRNVVDTTANVPAERASVGLAFGGRMIA
jgi:hypothetical protein